MKTQSIENYVVFGTIVRYIQDASTGSRIKGTDYILANLHSFFKNLDLLNLQVTKRASIKLNEIMDEFELVDEDAGLTNEQATKLSQIMSDVRKTLMPELGGFNVYVVTPKRLDVNKLLDNVSLLFAPSVFEKLPEIAQFDINESGKCISFDRPTGAAFHILRATESVLRAFYCHHKRRKTTDKVWGSMLQDLEKIRKMKNNSEYSVLLNNLNNIRLSFRNPTQHPDKIYDIQEVQDLWGLCVDVITRMSKDIPVKITK